MLSAADKQFTLECEDLASCTVLYYVDDDELDDAWSIIQSRRLLYHRCKGMSDSDIAITLGRKQEKCDLELARLGHIQIASGVSPLLVAEKYKFTAHAYFTVCAELGPPQSLVEESMKARDMKTVVRQILIAEALRLVKEIDDSHKKPNSVLSRSVTVINSELADLLKFISQ